MVICSGQNFPKRADRIFHRDIDAFQTAELFGDRKRLRQEVAETPRPRDRLTIFFAQFVHAQNRDDILQFFIAL